MKKSEQTPVMVLRKLPHGKFPPGWFPQDNSHPENSHKRKFPPRISPTRTIPTQIIAIQKILSNIVPSQNNIQPSKFLLIMFAIRPSHMLFPIWGQGKSSLRHTNVKPLRVFYATNILYEQFSKIVKCLIITPPLNKQQGDSKKSENPVS